VHLFVQIVSWVVAAVWVIRVWDAHRGLPGIPDLLLAEYDVMPLGSPTLTVIVPARDEQKHVRACLESLLQQDYAEIRIIAVDDRSTDSTGDLMEALAAIHPEKIRVIHVTDLPAGWLGKTHAMALAAVQTNTDFLLFTDADILFRPDALRRALANAVATRADHLVLAPTTIIHRWDEAGLLSFFQIFGLWAARPWKVADPKAHDAIGIGAFNLVRTGAYRQIGGFEAFPMEIVEDLGLARRVKWAGLAQRMAFGRGMVRVHWAPGVPGLINVMTKNIFSAFNFHATLLLGACGWLVLFCAAPFLAVFVPGLLLPSIVTLCAIAYGYVLMGRPSGLSAWNVLLAPFAACLFIYALCRSMVITLLQRGVIWRGTFYSLNELRKHTVPLTRRR
jgi:glycosyltransferase involved in cell wall biosynthesis